MSSLIDDYEQQYSQLTAEATSLIGRLGSITNDVLDIDERRQLIQNTDQLLEEAGGILEQIGLEIRDCDPGQRPSLTSKLNCYGAELKRLKNEFQTTRNTRSSVVTTNMGGGNAYIDDDAYFGEDQRQRLLDNSERLERTGNRLTNAYRVALETEEVGGSVLRDLVGQRETLTRARSRVRF